MYSERIKTAVLAATSWLRENRDRHITGQLAVDARGDQCKPNSPDAECFCVLGRISKELDTGEYPDDGNPEFKQFLRDTGIDPEGGSWPVYDMNDEGYIDPATGEKIRAAVCARPMGNPKVLDYLESKVNENGQ